MDGVPIKLSRVLSDPGSDVSVPNLVIQAHQGHHQHKKGRVLKVKHLAESMMAVTISSGKIVCLREKFLAHSTETSRALMKHHSGKIGC